MGHQLNYQLGTPNWTINFGTSNGPPKWSSNLGAMNLLRTEKEKDKVDRFQPLMHQEQIRKRLKLIGLSHECTESREGKV